jgi:hypothetical protein
MPGSELSDMIDELNGGGSIGSTLKFQLVNQFKGKLELLRPWMVLRHTDASKSVTPANTWETAIDLSSISLFSRFHGDWPVRLFDGRQIHRYRQVPYAERLEHINVSNTFVFHVATKTLHLNGNVPFAGTLYISHLKTTPALDANSTATAWPFPGAQHGLLAHGAVAIHKGGVDYDEVNARQLIMNNKEARDMIDALITWDSNLQLAEINQFDQAEGVSGPQAGRINLHG